MKRSLIASLLFLAALTGIAAEPELAPDLSICEVHHSPMELRQVPIHYGLPRVSKSEDYCLAHYPHWRTFVLGGCVVGDAKTARLYVCPACVAACDEYTRKHPESKDK